MIASRFDEMVERKGSGKRYAVQTKSELVRNTEADPIAQAPSFGYVHEYWHVITLAQTFRANDVQLKNATETSKRVLAGYLYSDVLKELDAILQAAYANDFEAVVKTANALRRDLINIFDEN